MSASTHITTQTVNPWAVRLARNVQAARKEAGMTQTDVAIRSGLLTQAISRIENEQTKVPNLTTLLRLSTAMGIPASVLLEGVDNSGNMCCGKPKHCVSFCRQRMTHLDSENAALKDHITKLEKHIVTLSISKKIPHNG